MGNLKDLTPERNEWDTRSSYWVEGKVAIDWNDRLPDVDTYVRIGTAGGIWLLTNAHDTGEAVVWADVGESPLYFRGPARWWFFRAKGVDPHSVPLMAEIPELGRPYIAS